MVILMIIITGAFMLIMGLFGLSHVRIKRMELDFNSGEVARGAGLFLIKMAAGCTMVLYMVFMLLAWVFVT